MFPTHLLLWNFDMYDIFSSCKPEGPLDSFFYRHIKGALVLGSDVPSLWSIVEENQESEEISCNCQLVSTRSPYRY
jgi:hypothetical protein